MGYKYQNRLDEENERARWQRMPRWKRAIMRPLSFVMMAALIILALCANFGWVIGVFR